VDRPGPVWPDPRKTLNGRMNFEFQLNLDFGKTLRNSTRRFRWNLDMGIFLNSSRLLKDF
jgi:hypothetical protein